MGANAAPAGSTSPEEARVSWWVSPPLLPQGDPTSAHLHLSCVTLRGSSSPSQEFLASETSRGFLGCLTVPWGHALRR